MGWNPGARRWTNEEKQLLILRYGNDSTEELAKRLNRTPKQVREAAKRFCKLDKRERWERHREDILRLHEEGKSTLEMARELGVSIRTLEYWLAREGLKGNGHGQAISENLSRAKARTRIVRWLAANYRVVWKAIRKAFPAEENAEEVIGWFTLEDVFSDVCLTAMRRAGSHDRSRGAISTWMYWVVKGVVGKLRRYVTRRPESQWPINEIASPFDPASHAWQEEMAAKEDLEHLTRCRERTSGGKNWLGRLRTAYFSE